MTQQTDQSRAAADMQPRASSPPATPSATSAQTWVISDGAAGNERQALSLASAMGLTTKVLRIQLRAPWSWFAPRMNWASTFALSGTGAGEFTAPWPTLAIGCGRQAALLTRSLRQLSGGRTYTIQILDPRIPTTEFDLVIAPRHDAVAGANVIQTLGALNLIDDHWLQRGKVEFSTLEQLPHPRTALLIGGPRRDLGLDDAWFDTLIRKCRDALSIGGSLLITASRRTPPQWRARLRGAFDNGCAYFWDGPQDGANPYAGYLAAADRIVVTPDSVNMLSEACATGKPVYSFLPSSAQGKLRLLHEALRAQGWLHDGDLDMHGAPAAVAPLRELAAVTSKVWHQIEATRPDIGAMLGNGTATTG